jgi:hypothetical protein
MNPIPAAENHSIQSSYARWRLLYNDKPLAEASPRGFRYGARFGSSRRLNESGVLERHDILQVVLGWQQTDESWHLGLILAPHVAEERGSRWCELVSWPDPEIHVFQDLAQLAGQQLAQALEIPFYVIPPQSMQAPAPPPSLPELPLVMGDWTLENNPQDKRQLLIQRGKAWDYRKMGRISWYTLWVVIYLVVSIATLNSNIALPNTGTLLPNPHILPYLGLGVAVFLAGLAIYHCWLLVSEPDHLIIDSAEGTISAWKDNKRKWIMNTAELQSVYVSEVAKKRRGQFVVEYAELNIHLGSGSFRFLLKEKEPQYPKSSELSLELKDEGIYELNRYNVQTEMQAVALYLAEALGIAAAWYDLRVDQFRMSGGGA